MLYRLSLILAVVFTYFEFTPRYAPGNFEIVSPQREERQINVNQSDRSPSPTIDRYRVKRAIVITIPDWIFIVLLMVLVVAVVFWVIRKNSLFESDGEMQESGQKNIENDRNNLQKSSQNGLVKNNPNPDLNYSDRALPIQQTTRLPKLDIVAELIKDLQQSESSKRRKIIWELAQRSGSRAIKPLLELTIEADSQERSLILTAISSIATRALKPMNQAFKISLEDRNPQVRKNAIRDVTTVYELMSEVTQRLSYLSDDEDKEVRETVEWALKQLNKVQTYQNLPQKESNNNQMSTTDEFDV